MREMPLALDGQQAILQGDLQVVGLDPGQLDRDQVGVLTLGDVQRRRPRRGGGPTAALRLAVQAERVGKPRAHLGHLGHLVLRVAQVLERVPSHHGGHLVSLLRGPCGPAARGGRRSWVIGVHLPSNAVHCTLNDVYLSRSSFRSLNMEERVGVQNRVKAPPHKRARAASGAPATDGRSRSLWFNAPMDDRDRRPQLTRERVVAEALAVIAKEGVQALTMRTLAARLGVVPGALYHHVRNKEQLQDLVLDGVLAEVDFHVAHAQPWTQQIKVLAQRLREVLEQHPGVAGLLKTRDPLGPHSLALAEHVWLDNRDERFAAGLDVLVDGLEQTRRSPPRPTPRGRTTTTRTT